MPRCRTAHFLIDRAYTVSDCSVSTTTRLYLFAPQYVQSISAILRATVTITPRISLQAFAQLFTEGLAYGDPLRAVVGPAIRLDQLTRATAADQAPSLDDRNADLSMN